MKDKKVLALAGLLSLETLLGCGGKYPQYSGRYELQSVSYSNPSFAGKQPLPSSLELTERMKHHGGHWDHYLKFNFIPQSSTEAPGIFTLELDDLARIDHGAWPNDWYDGAEIHREQKIYGTGTVCNYQYLYFLFMASTPSTETMQNMYPGQGECFAQDPVTKMPLCKSLAHPEEVDFNDTDWYDTLDENEGITLTLTFTRHLRSELPGGEDSYKDCILSSDPENRGEAAMTFTYYADKKNLDDRTDIRKAVLEKTDPTGSSLSFFKKVVSGIK